MGFGSTSQVSVLQCTAFLKINTVTIERLEYKYELLSRNKMFFARTLHVGDCTVTIESK